MEVKGFTINVNDLLAKQKKKSTVCDNFNMQILINNVIVFDDMTYGQCEVPISFTNNITANDTIQIIASPPGYEPINSIITITPEILT